MLLFSACFSVSWLPGTAMITDWAIVEKIVWRNLRFLTLLELRLHWKLVTLLSHCYLIFFSSWTIFMFSDACPWLTEFCDCGWCSMRQLLVTLGDGLWIQLRVLGVLMIYCFAGEDVWLFYQILWLGIGVGVVCVTEGGVWPICLVCVAYHVLYMCVKGIVSVAVWAAPCSIDSTGGACQDNCGIAMFYVVQAAFDSVLDIAVFACILTVWASDGREVVAVCACVHVMDIMWLAFLTLWH